MKKFTVLCCLFYLLSLLFIGVAYKNIDALIFIVLNCAPLLLNFFIRKKTNYLIVTLFYLISLNVLFVYLDYYNAYQFIYENTIRVIDVPFIESTTKFTFWDSLLPVALCYLINYKSKNDIKDIS